MITEKQVRKLVEAHFEGSEFFLVEMSIKPGNRISIYVDGDHRVGIEVCRGLSHFIEENLDRETEDFELTVSSAGADRPLKLPRQYRKNIGNELEIITTAGTKITGKVLNADETAVTVEQKAGKKPAKYPETTPVTLKFDDIKSAKEVISFKK